MLKVIVPALLAAALFCQTPPPPEIAPAAPPEVEKALRARVDEFYQLEIAGKFNQALQLVADDTKDMFVGSSKPTLYQAETLTIKYSDDFTKALVMSMVARMLPIQGFVGHPLSTKVPTRWKVEKGQWCYYVDPILDMPTTPFGRAAMPPGLGTPGISAQMPMSGVPHAQPPLPANLANPRSLVANKTSVQIAAAKKSAADVAISNPSPWPVGLNVADPKVKGLTVKLDRTTIKPGEKAILHIESDGAMEVPKTPLTVMVSVPQANQTIPIKLNFAN